MAVGAALLPVRSTDGVARKDLAGLQRARIVRAMIEVCCERGAANVTVTHVAERAGVSRRTFYEVFEDREACFLAAFEYALAYASERVLPAFEAEGRWRERVGASLRVLLDLFGREPAIGRVLVVESFSGGPRIARRRGQVLRVLTEAIAQGASEAKANAAFSPLVAEGVVGGVLSVLGSRLTEKDASLLELASPLMSMIVLPYLGPAAARKELERPSPAPMNDGGGIGHLADPFKDTGLRMTYRTVRVLVAIADLVERGVCPSNSSIAAMAEIRDQGQVSKLLARLRRAGMIVNADLAPGRGASNSWQLTDTGRRVFATIRTSSQDRSSRVR